MIDGDQTSLKPDPTTLHNVQHLLGYFEQGILAAYKDEPDKYCLELSDFEGVLRCTSEWILEHEDSVQDPARINVRFGYRKQTNGNNALVVYMPDLVKSPMQFARWKGFWLESPQWDDRPDDLFSKWFRRNIEGCWEVDNDAHHYLNETIEVINSVTLEMVGVSLYSHTVDDTLNRPSSENTHRYQDAHKELYGYLIDGLNKDCIARLYSLVNGQTLNVANLKTLNAMTRLLPNLEHNSLFSSTMRRISDQRNLAAHGKRAKAEPFPASTTFSKDLADCVSSLNDLRNQLEQHLSVDAEKLHVHHLAKQHLPVIVAPPQGHFSIVQSHRMEGKTVERVECGFRRTIEGVHGSEVIIVHFTDGSSMGIDTGSNVGNLIDDDEPLKPENFHVDFDVRWVPPRQ